MRKFFSGVHKEFRLPWNTYTVLTYVTLTWLLEWAGNK